MQMDTMMHSTKIARRKGMCGICFLAGIWFAGLLAGCSSPGGRAPDAPVAGELRRELLAMEEADQRVRNAYLSAVSDATVAEMTALDAQHTARMREIIKEYGWPGRSLVGAEGASAAWLLVQHADAAADFQAECLPLMERAVAAGEASVKEYAYLVDRVRKNAGKPQVYGTQFVRTAGGDLAPYPIEDATRVDERRRSVGLGSLARYQRTLRRLYRR